MKQKNKNVSRETKTKGLLRLQTFTVKGKAINLFIKAESREAAERIFAAPLVEVAKQISSVWFERKEI